MKICRNFLKYLCNLSVDVKLFQKKKFIKKKKNQMCGVGGGEMGEGGQKVQTSSYKIN